MIKDDSLQLLSLSDIEVLTHYLKKANYLESNHNLMNMFIWQDMFPIYRYIDKDYVLLMSKHKETHFCLMPLCEPVHVHKALLKGKELFENMRLDFVISAATSEFKDLALSYFDNFKVSTARDGYDYVYSRDSIVSLSGKKLQKRRNLYNRFVREYEGRTSLAPLHSVISLVLSYMEALNEEIDDEYQVHERNGIINLLGHLELFDYQGAALFIDDEIKGFIITSLLDDTMVQINIEKADKTIPGIYQYLESEYFKMFYPDILYINKEDDMGKDNLRQAKMASKPLFLIEKYRLCEGDCHDK